MPKFEKSNAGTSGRPLALVFGVDIGLGFVGCGEFAKNTVDGLSLGVICGECGLGYGISPRNAAVGRGGVGRGGGLTLGVSRGVSRGVTNLGVSSLGVTNLGVACGVGCGVNLGCTLGCAIN